MKWLIDDLMIVDLNSNGVDSCGLD